jgi:hypothetical protein
MPDMTLSEAAKWAGKTRPAIFKAIKAGRISARKNDDGEWLIDPAELARVYQPPEPVNVSGNSAGEQQDIGGELAALRQINAVLEEQIRDLKVQREDWKTERDRLLGVVESQTRLITHMSQTAAPAAEPLRPSWWQRLRGKV